MYSDTQLREQMRAIEGAACKSSSAMQSACDSLWKRDATLAAAVFAGLGSKYLAVGSPESIGILTTPTLALPLMAVHRLLFGDDLQFRLLHPCENVANATTTDMEQVCACDILCAPSDAAIDAYWLAEATHVNLTECSLWSPGFTSLAQFASATLQYGSNAVVGNLHGQLADVITGTVSGRMGEEITLLLSGPPTG